MATRRPSSSGADSTRKEARKRIAFDMKLDKYVFITVVDLTIFRRNTSPYYSMGMIAETGFAVRIFRTRTHFQEHVPSLTQGLAVLSSKHENSLQYLVGISHHAHGTLVDLLPKEIHKFCLQQGPLALNLVYRNADITSRETFFSRANKPSDPTL
jgi:hypothetical protein